MKTSLFLFPHCDDEVFILPVLKQELQKNEQRVLCIWLTVPRNSQLAQVRELETRTVMQKLGARTEHLFFIGLGSHSYDGVLAKSLASLWEKIRLILDGTDAVKSSQEVNRIYSPLYEGGHQDHDACAVLAHLLGQHVCQQAEVFYFPCYQGEGLPGRMFRVARPLTGKNTPVEWVKLGWRDLFDTLMAVSAYKTQKKTWIGLLPGLLLQIAWRRQLYLVKSPFKEQNADNLVVHRPHDGPLLYERYGRATFLQFRTHISQFFNCKNQ